MNKQILHEAATALGHGYIESNDICDNFKTALAHQLKFISKPVKNI